MNLSSSPAPLTKDELPLFPLFRLLAFLDTTGIQAFDAEVELSAEGEFLRPDYLLFTPDLNGSSTSPTPFSKILFAACCALQENLSILCSSEEVGAELVADARDILELLSLPISTVTDKINEEKGKIEEAMQRSSWVTLVCSSSSIRGIDEAFAAYLPLASFLKLKSLLLSPLVSLIHPEQKAKGGKKKKSIKQESDSKEITNSSSGDKMLYCCPENMLAEQFLIDGVDRWLRESHGKESSSSPLQQIVLACGGVLSPEIVLPLLSRDDGVTLLIDFVLDVLFPLSLTPQASSSSICSDKAKSATTRRSAKKEESLDVEEKGVVLDWLILSYQKNREFGAPLKSDCVSDPSETRKKNARTLRRDSALISDAETANCDSKGDRKRTRKETLEEKQEKNCLESQQDNDDVFLSSENFEAFMLQHPSRLPRAVLEHSRRAISDPLLTTSEMDKLYKATELRDIVQKMIRERENTLDSAAEVGTPSSVEEVLPVPLPLSNERWAKAKRATKKKEFISFLMDLYPRSLK